MQNTQQSNWGVERQLDYCNLDVIISVGYRVTSLRGTQFREWATKRLNEYIRKGFTLDDERLKQGSGRFSQSARFPIPRLRRISGPREEGDDNARLIGELDRQLAANRRTIPHGKGTISHRQAITKAEEEFETFDRAIRQLAQKDEEPTD